MLSVLIPLACLSISPEVRMPDQAGKVVEGNNQFALDLYSKLRDVPGNLFFSPYSISTALAMTSGGARGPTLDEMARTLHLPAGSGEIHPAIASIGKALNAGISGRGYQLSVANRLWGQQGSHFRPDFLALTRDAYGAELAPVDFARQTEPARLKINAWVEDRTRGKIRDLIQPGDLDPMTRLVLANAIYFKGDWSSPFDKGKTREAPFHAPGGRDVRVPLMNRRSRLAIREGDGMKILGLPYGAGDLSMVVLLPDAADGLPALEARLTAGNVAGWLGGLREAEVDVFLPRFAMDSRFKLAGVLRSVGMARAFTPGRADFSGISSEADLYLSEAVHQAFVDVNEEGTEAAAATSIISQAPSPPPPPAILFRADHPFVFLIRDDRTGSILFLGRLATPKG